MWRYVWFVALLLWLSAACTVYIADDAVKVLNLLGTEAVYHEESVCDIAYHRCKDAYSSQLERNPTLSANNPIGLINAATGNYKVSFDITPRGTVSNWNSILHFSNGQECCVLGSRSPAFWFNPDTTRLYATVGDSTDSHWGIDVPSALPINVRTTVTLECVGKNVTLTVGATVYTATQPTHRYVGKLVVYAGNWVYPVPNAVVENLRYEILPKTNAGCPATR